MANTTVIIKTFNDLVFKITPFEETIINVKPFDDLVVTVPGAGEVVNEGFDYTLDLILS